MWYIHGLFVIVLLWAKIFFAVFVFSAFFEKRKHFKLRLFLSLAVSFAAIISISLFELDFNKFIASVVVYFTISVSVIILLIVCYKGKPMNYLFHYFSAMFLSTAGNSIRGAYLHSGQIVNDGWFDMLMSITVTVIIYGLVWFAFVRPNSQKYRKIEINKTILGLYTVNAVIMLGMTYVANTLGDAEIIKAIIIDFCIVGYSFVLLLIQYTFLLKQYSVMRETKERMEREVLEQISNEALKQYDLLKENMEIINIKCHDMRKQLLHFRKHGKLHEEYISELEKAVDIYDCTVETGNEALDVILSEATLRCRAKKIKLSCLADGKALSLISLPDIYSLFGNAVDNAIEHLVNLSEEKRFIRLNVKEEGHFLLVHIENYFEGTVAWKDGLPRSGKDDKAYHGFGVSSIKRIAEKYNGNLQIETSHNLFQLNICIPIKRGQ